MRIIILGMGAVGGTMAAGLALAGYEVLGIARGAQLQAIRDRGLRLVTHDGPFSVAIDCVSAPAEIAFRPDDVVVVAVKSQHGSAALEALVSAGFGDRPVFCAQNGVDNERAALRRFANVHGMTVMLPAEFTQPGEIVAFGAPKWGMFDIGRCPEGADEADHAMAAALEAGPFKAFVLPRVMESKYDKLVVNLRNIIHAALGEGPVTDRATVLARKEARAVYTAAGIGWRDVGMRDPRRDAYMRLRPLEGVERTGSSTAQSLVRATGTVETDYLNGEICLLGRLHGVATPVNAWFCEVAARMLRDGHGPGTVAAEEAVAALPELGELPTKSSS